VTFLGPVLVTVFIPIGSLPFTGVYQNLAFDTLLSAYFVHVACMAYSALKMEAVHSSKTSVNDYQFT
jgi:hypothetical protein